MSDMYVYMYVCMHVCTKSFLKTTTNSSCVCTHLANKADSDSDSLTVEVLMMDPMQSGSKFTDRITKYLTKSAERKTTRASKSKGHVISE